MSDADKVRWSRDGDQFHYVWAARLCLSLLPGNGGLTAVSIEGPSTRESPAAPIDPGEELIDVGLYYGAESIEAASAVHYVQLKHSTQQATIPWTASGLEKTIAGFAKRYAKLVEKTSADDVAKRFRFRFTTNRPINDRVATALVDLANGRTDRHKKLRDQLEGFTGLVAADASAFFSLFSAEGDRDGLWAQRNLLAEDIRAYLPDGDYDAPVQLKDLVSRKASSEFKRDPVIRRYDVLHVLKVGGPDLYPAANLIQGGDAALARAQEPAILEAILRTAAPTILHADGGVGKSMLAMRLAASIPGGGQAVVYDCFGDGSYRSAHNWRHRHRDAFTQIANELAGRGLCHPLIPTNADAKLYVRAFTHRLAQAASALTSADPSAVLCVIIDAADNAEMAAEDNKEPSSFVRDLINMPLPPAVRLVFTCRSHRRTYLKAQSTVQEIELQPFTLPETTAHLRRGYPMATAAEAAEFAHVSSSNPRVQAMAMEKKRPLAAMLQGLGPNPTTVAVAIGGLLSDAVNILKKKGGAADSQQIDQICQGLAVLRPLIPIPVLERLTGIDGGAIRSFAYDLGRSLMVRGDTLHFMDEPAETWFRETFTPDASEFDAFILRLRPLASQSAYVAGVLPQLLLEAGRHGELVELALSSEALPIDNPLERRDVELQRLLFALKASLQQGSQLAAAKLALKAAGETAGEDRQIFLLRSNIHLASKLLAPDRILDIASRRLIKTQWMGSHHAYEAVLLSGRPEFAADSASHLRMAMEWLMVWARHVDELQDDHDFSRIEVTDDDKAALAMAHLRVSGAKAAARFLRSWTHRPTGFTAGGQLAAQLVDLGDFDALGALAEAARNNVWLLLALAQAARSAGRSLPARPLERMLRLLGYRRFKVEELGGWNERWDILKAVTASIELALIEVPPQPDPWSQVLRRYLPDKPPSDFTSRFPFDRSGLLSAYALEAALRGEDLKLADVAPKDVRRQLEREGYAGSMSSEAETFVRETGGLLPWVQLTARILCGRGPQDLDVAINEAVGESEKAGKSGYRDDSSLRNNVILLWLRLLADNGMLSAEQIAAVDVWRAKTSRSLWPQTLTALCHRAARTEGLQSLALDFATEAHAALAASREEAGTRTESYLQLSRAVFAVSPAEARAYLEEAVAIASRIGEENLDRWAAFLHLAHATGETGNPRPRTAYRLSRMAELTYEYVERDKYFPWDDTVEAISKICPPSSLAILSRWRDRRFGRSGRLLPIAIGELVSSELLPPVTVVALSGLHMEWERATDIISFLDAEKVEGLRRKGTEIAYRYLRLGRIEGEAWTKFRARIAKESWSLSDLERVHAANTAASVTTVDSGPAPDPQVGSFPVDQSGRDRPVWHDVFAGLDLSTAESLTVAYGRMRGYKTPHQPEAFWKEAAARVPAGREPELMRAFADWPDATIFNLRYALENFPAAWRGRLAFRQAMRAAILKTCRAAPVYVYRRGWNQVLPFDELIAQGVLTDEDVVEATLQGFITTLGTLDAGGLFRLLDPVSSRLTPAEADEALNFGLDLMEPILKPEDGDGDWSGDLAPPTELVGCLAAYVWAGLASPSGADRWAFAHVVRNVVELGWTELLEALAVRADSGVPGPFVDAGLHFYNWHAQQWLLIGLARGALERPERLAPFSTWLRKMAADPHVIIAELASRCLRLWAEVPAGTSEDLTWLTQVNRPQQAETGYRSWREALDDDPDAPDPPEDEKYYFGHDISQYWLAPMGQAFGLSQKAVERWALKAVRTNLGWGGHSWRDDARHERKLFLDGEAHHSHGSLPESDDLGTYHGYHALMLAAGLLLRERSVGRGEEETRNDFEIWMDRHWLGRKDGRWLFDRADPAIVKSPPHASKYEPDWPWLVDLSHLDAQLTSPDGEVLLWGHWKCGSDSNLETVDVRSALVTQSASEALLSALQTASDTGGFALPTADQEDGIEIADGQLFGWVRDQGVSAELEELDPWSEKLRFPAAVPADDIVERLELTSDVNGRTWNGGSGAALFSESWTVRQGFGQEAETVPGWRLSGNPAFIQALLGAYPGHRLVLSVKIRRNPGRSRQGDFESYPWPYTRYYLMRSDVRPKPL